jgi:putative spermidine/putrescine transport system permease protein
MGPLLLRTTVAAIIFFLSLPLIYVILTSFNASPAMGFPPTSFTVQWYGQIPHVFWAALRLSLIVAAFTTLISTLLGTGVALAVARSRTRTAAFISAFCLSPLTVPALVLGVALLQFAIAVKVWTGISVLSTPAAVVAGHVALTLPYVVRTVLASHAHYDLTLEEAALNLGSTPFQVFRSVTLPSLLPGIASGAVFAILISLDDVPVALLTLPGEDLTLPLQILSVVEYDFSPSVMAVSAVLIYGSLIMVILINALVGIDRMFGLPKS